MAKKITRLALLLDYSEEMDEKADEAIEAFNSFIYQQKELEGDLEFSLFLFNEKDIKPRYLSVDIQEVKPLNLSTFKPRHPAGLETVAIDEIIKTIGRKKDVLFFVYSPSDMFITMAEVSLVEKKIEEGWTFKAYTIENCNVSQFFFGLNHYVIQARRGVENPVWKQ